MKAVKRKYITVENPANEKFGKVDLHESIRKVLKEAEDEIESDEELTDDVTAELETELEGNELETELTTSQEQTVEDWADELLKSNIVNLEDDSDILDSEASVEGLDSNTELLNDNVGIDAEDLETIIDEDNSLELLQNELESAVLELENEIADENDNELLDEAVELLETIVDEESDDMLEEAIGLLESLSNEGPVLTGDVKKATEEEMAKAKKESGADIVSGDKRNADVLKTTEKHFTKITADNKAKLNDAKIEKLVLENYSLMKVNNLLAVAGDLLTEASRVSLIENFAKCKSKQEVNEAYKSVTTKLKNVTEKNKEVHSLNEAVAKGKTKVSVIKESAEKQIQEVDLDFERKKHLMGFKTKANVYNK